MTRPAKEAGHAEASLEDCSLGLRERCLAAIGPGEDFGAVVRGEHDNGVVVFAHVLQLIHYDADVVIQLRHAGFFFRPAIFGVAQRLVFRREVRDDMHAGRVEPDEKRLVVGLGFVDEFEGEVANLVIHCFHALGIERTGVLNLLFADLAPARHHGRVIRSSRPRMHHVARANDIQEILRIVRMRRVFHRVEVIEVAKELVETVDGGQILIEIAKVILTELPGGIAHGLEYRCGSHSLRG